MVRRRGRPETLSPLFHLFAASQAVGGLLADALASSPLTPAQYAFYSAVRELQPVSPTDLSRRLGMAFTTTTDTIKEMVRRGHAVRVRNPADGRSFLIRLSEDGEVDHQLTHEAFEVVELTVARLLGARRVEVIEALEMLQSAAASAHEQLRSDVADTA